MVLRAGLLLLLAFGAAGFAQWLDTTSPWRLRVQPQGAFWQLTDADGAVGSLIRRGRGLPLVPGQQLVVRDDGAAARTPDILSVQAVRPGPACALQLELPLADGATALARVWPAEPYRLELLRREVDGSERLLHAAPATIPTPGSPESATPAGVFARLSEYFGFEWRLLVRGSRLEGSLQGVPLVTADMGAAATGPPTLTPLEGPVTLLGLTLQGGSAGQRQVLDERFDELAAPTAWARALHHGTLPLLVVLLALATLRALCAGSPGTAPLLDATAMALAPAAAVFVGHATVGLSHVEWLAAAGLVAGLLPALRRLGQCGAFEAGETPGRLVRPMVVAGVVALATLLLTADRRLERLDPLLAEEARAASAPRAPEPAAIARQSLDASNVLHLPGPFRDFDLDARVTLGPGAILEVRTRAPDPRAARGFALFVPADDVPPPASLTSAGTRWVWEEVGLLAPLGGPGPRLAPSEATALHIEARGRSLSAWLGDRSPILRVGAAPLVPKATARMGSLREPTGDVLLLAARGQVTIEELSLVPRPSTAASDPRPAAWRTSCLPLLAALGLALLAAHLLGFGPARAAETQALALAPLALALLRTTADGGLPQDALTSASLLAVVLAALPAARARTPGGRRLLFVLLTALVLPGSFAVATERPLPMDGRTINDLAYTEVHGEPLAADRLHLEHPLLRRWNGWLADHGFKGRHTTLVPPADTQRVLVLGGSSTWGYHVPESAGLDWPTRVGRLLEPPPGSQVEVLNAAWPAATGARILPFLEHALLALQPGVVVLCLGYNDGFALARPDEAAWFARRLSEGTAWSAWAMRTDILDELAARRVFLQELVASDAGAPALPRSASSRSGPPAAFELLLERYADLCAAHDVTLVLVVEPLSPDNSLRWSTSMAEAMTAVAQRRGLPLVDPRETLAQHGDDELFMDVVHPTPAGHAVIAEVVAHALQRVLRAPR